MTIKAILTDIEGTTSSLSFVKDVLFPYARNHLEAFISMHESEQAVAELLEDVRSEFGKNLSVGEIIRLMQSWIDEDRKVTPLKSLQGLIWEAGYQQGDFKGHVYPDAYENMKKWHDSGLALYVYSSGSVFAQKLLFAHTYYGDLTPMFNGYFDTHIGHKRDMASYANIAIAMQCRPQEVLFLSDIREELDAARNAGMQTCWLVRDADVDPAATHRQARDFSAVVIG